MTALKNTIRRKHSQMGYTTNLEERRCSRDKRKNGLAERAIQTVRRQAATLVQALQAKCRVGMGPTFILYSHGHFVVQDGY